MFCIHLRWIHCHYSICLNAVKRYVPCENMYVMIWNIVMCSYWLLPSSQPKDLGKSQNKINSWVNVIVKPILIWNHAWLLSSHPENLQNHPPYQGSLQIRPEIQSLVEFYPGVSNFNQYYKYWSNFETPG